jgi:spore germination protein KA/spore germination protein
MRAVFEYFTSGMVKNDNKILPEGAAMNITANRSIQDLSISETIAENAYRLKAIFDHCADIMYDYTSFGPDMSCTALTVYCDSLAENQQGSVMLSVLKNIELHRMESGASITSRDIREWFENQGVIDRSYEIHSAMESVVRKILQGHIVIFIEQWNHAVSFEGLKLKTRDVDEPTAERVAIGPREGTVENLSVNIGMIRLRLQTPDLKFVNIQKAGKKTGKKVVYGYLDGVVPPEVLQQFEQRIGRIKNHELIDTTMIEKLIQESAFSPFPQCRFTERTDAAALALLDGKIIVMMEGSGVVLICPALFVEFLQSIEDYYHRFVFTFLIRLLRMTAFLIALFLPSIYVALSTFHPELIPTVLLLAITNTREGIPFPAVVEVIIMEFFFELLREAGIRLPQAVGSAVSIVGALIIGQAAIDSGIASPIMIVVVALTGIASFSIPQYSFAIALRLLKIPFIILAATLGGFGIMIGILLMLLHLSSLRSLGQAYFDPIGPFRPQRFKKLYAVHSVLDSGKDAA